MSLLESLRRPGSGAPAPTSPTSPTSSAPSGRRDVLLLVAPVAAVAAVLARLPYLHLPATPDEGGFLLVASQWHRGTSLYGDLWVDRPPLLIALHALAAALGGVVALRVIGLLAVVATVLLTAALVRAAVPPTATLGTPRVAALLRSAPVALVACLLASPLLGSSEVSGEVLYAPFVLAGLVALVRAFTTAAEGQAWRWSLLAGFLAMTAMLVKQNAIDVFVVAAVTVLAALRRGGDDRARAWRITAGGLGGALATLMVVVGLAALRGTDPAALYDAVVTFRFQAGHVIDEYSAGAEDARAVRLIGAAVVSGLVPALVVLLLRVARRVPALPTPTRPGARALPDLRWAALAVLAWEAVAVAGGGSYWLHYLVVLVPGAALLAVASAQRPIAGGRAVRVAEGTVLAAAVALTVASSGYALATTTGLGPARESDSRVAAYLDAHARPGDTAVVAFGHPDILWESGLRSPYEHLWSLPVRVRDSRLTEFDAVLGSSRAPTWVVVHGQRIGGWGLSPARAERTLEQRYRQVAAPGAYTVWRLERAR